jgi:hypothetical protein
MKEKLRLMLDIYRSRLKEAQDSNQHARALEMLGAVSVLETLWIYVTTNPSPNKPVELDSVYCANCREPSTLGCCHVCAEGAGWDPPQLA